MAVSRDLNDLFVLWDGKWHWWDDVASLACYQTRFDAEEPFAQLTTNIRALLDTIWKTFRWMNSSLVNLESRPPGDQKRLAYFLSPTLAITVSVVIPRL